MADSALVARDLHVERAGRTVLEQVSLTLRDGEVLGVLGPNGAGKSTLLRALSGLAQHRGEVWIRGQRIEQLSVRERARVLSFVPQQSRLSAALRVWEVVAQGRYAHQRSVWPQPVREEPQVHEALARVAAQQLAHRAFNELSLGEQKRVLVARALCTGARVLLLDEPTASLDIEHVLRFGRLMRELAAQGHALIVVLHQLDEALRVADHALLLKEGRTLAVGPARQVLDAAHVRALYGVQMVPQGGLGFRLPDEEP